MFLEEDVEETEGKESKNLAPSRSCSVYVNAVKTLVVDG
jgi:hypothetical protein